MVKRNLTNERLKKIFNSIFDLANYAIDVGKNYVLSGHYTNLDSLLVEIRRRAEGVKDPEEKRKLGIR